MDEITRTLLTRIVNEPGFREYLQSDPVAALASVGFAVDPERLPATIVLPPDDQVQAILALEPVWDHIQGCMTVQSLIGWQTH